MPTIKNQNGGHVATFQSDAEAVRWWYEYGYPGDYLADTGELVADVAAILDLDDWDEEG